MMESELRYTCIRALRNVAPPRNVSDLTCSRPAGSSYVLCLLVEKNEKGKTHLVRERWGRNVVALRKIERDTRAGRGKEGGPHLLYPG
jgi:hypothetical protein